MKKIKILDCTLRDGGRIVDCKFQDEVIVGIGRFLRKAKIDIVELGFLRDHIEFDGNSTFFGEVEQADKYIEQIGEENQSFVLFVDYGLYNINNLAIKGNSKVSGIRYGFTRKNYLEHRDEIIADMNMIREKNYDLYIQTVFTNGYATTELLELISLVNEICPVSFGIVDTYGSMYLDDLDYIWNIVNHNLKKEIAIDFHSHNNMQMSFAMTQRIIQLSNNERSLVIDSTMNGIGKCAGNLNTELIVDYLVRKKNYDYNTDAILDAIDRYIEPLKKSNEWGYTVPAFMAGIYKAHPNNVIFLTSKYRLNNCDVKYILSRIDEEKRQRYDYDLIQKLYLEYSSTKVDDTQILEQLSDVLKGKKVLVLASGTTIETYKDNIIEYIEENNPVVVSVNFKPCDIKVDYVFFTNVIRWEEFTNKTNQEKFILSSNIHTDNENVKIVNYSSLIEECSVMPDNSTIMLLNLLDHIGATEIGIAGFDGFNEQNRNYIDGTEPTRQINMTFEQINGEVRKLFKAYRERVMGKIKVYTITPSKYC
ncbi:MAG: hypothetical protein PUB52_00285 [Lachnospiraceae bacterium]|nr:hypothetical protein [Lachnospiraceae bacterium]